MNCAHDILVLVQIFRGQVSRAESTFRLPSLGAAPTYLPSFFVVPVFSSPSLLDVLLL